MYFRRFSRGGGSQTWLDGASHVRLTEEREAGSQGRLNGASHVRLARMRGGIDGRWIAKYGYPSGIKGIRGRLFVKVLGAVGDIDMTARRGDDATTGEVVDGIGIVSEGGVEVKERDIGGAFFWSEDKADTLGKSLAKRVALLRR